MATGPRTIPKSINFTNNGNHNPLEVTPQLTTKPANHAMVYNNNSIVLMSIYDVEPFDNNPRRHRNPEEWAQLKESIRAVGVRQHIKVTKRPSASKFMVAEGGNSRLQILRELYEETNDEKFATIPVQQVDFVSENDVLIQHILENEQRSDVHFWDKASSYSQLVQKLGLVSKSHREISDFIGSKGLSISHVKISEFLWAANRLDHLGQLCFFLSGAKTIELRKMFYDFQNTKNLIQPRSETEFADFWNNQLTAFAAKHADDADLNIKLLLQQVESAHAELWAVLPTQPSTPALPKTNNGGLEQPFSPTEATPLSNEAQANEQEYEPAVAARSYSVPREIETTLPSSTAIYSAHESEDYQDGTGLINAVLNLLKHVNLDDTIRYDQRFPHGFYLEVPDLDLNANHPGMEYFIDQRHEDARSVFWFLVETTGQFDDTEDAFVMLPNDSRYKQFRINAAIDEDVASEMFNLLGSSEYEAVRRWLSYGEETLVELIQSFFKALRHCQNVGN